MFLENSFRKKWLNRLNGFDCRPRSVNVWTEWVGVLTLPLLCWLPLRRVVFCSEHWARKSKKFFTYAAFVAILVSINFASRSCLWPCSAGLLTVVFGRAKFYAEWLVPTKVFKRRANTTKRSPALSTEDDSKDSAMFISATWGARRGPRGSWAMDAKGMKAQRPGGKAQLREDSPANKQATDEIDKTNRRGKNENRWVPCRLPVHRKIREQTQVPAMTNAGVASVQKKPGTW